jgi:hypothetical protein
MLRIRREQMEVLGQMVLEEFERRAVAYLGQKYPQEATRRGEEGLLALVRQSRDRARTCALDSEIAVVTWGASCTARILTPTSPGPATFPVREQP